MTRLKEIIAKCDPDKVLKIFDEEYCPNNIDEISCILENLRYKTVPNCDKFKIVINENNDYFLVNGHTENMTIAIEFQPWDEWLGSEIFETTLAIYNANEIVAHCLMEMTCVSTDEDEIQATFMSILDLVDDIKKSELTDENGFKYFKIEDESEY
jgi:hypothetical protein